MAWLNDFSVTVHIVGVIAIVGALLFFAPKQPASFFFARITSNKESWPYWWAFIIGLLQAMWTYTGYDASASVSEETVIRGGALRGGWSCPWCFGGRRIFAADRVDAVDQGHRRGVRRQGRERQAVPAVIAILITALGERAGSLFSALAAMAMWFCGLSAVTWSSRVIWAFARDDGLPVRDCGSVSAISI